jgi:calcineurin-like phosphoesterase family protein
MSIVRFIADPHLGHLNMAKRRGFNTIEEHDEYFVKQWNSVVAKRDLTYILGDITMESAKAYPILDRLNGRKIVVGGNHDKPGHTRELLKHVDSIAGMIQYKGIFLTHCPVHPREMKYRIKHNIHGHIHENFIEKEFRFLGIKIFSRVDRRYHCVSCEHVNYTPKSLKELGITR